MSKTNWGEDGGKVDPINFAILYPPIFMDSIPSFQFLDPASSSHRPRGSAFQDPGVQPMNRPHMGRCRDATAVRSESIGDSLEHETTTVASQSFEHQQQLRE